MFFSFASFLPRSLVLFNFSMAIASDFAGRPTFDPLRLRSRDPEFAIFGARTECHLAGGPQSISLWADVTVATSAVNEGFQLVMGVPLYR